MLPSSGAGRKLFAHQNTKHHGEAGSINSSGLRREVQDSLSELERLIEQQHRQVRLLQQLPKESVCSVLWFASNEALICNFLNRSESSFWKSHDIHTKPLLVTST